MIEVLAAGPLSTVQDAGRVGYGHLGVPYAGPADWFGHALANRLVGNDDGAAALECTVSGPRLRFGTDAVIAVVGADVRVEGEPVPIGAPTGLVPSVARIMVVAGQHVTVGRTWPGIRAYLAVAGGVDVPPVLGSRSSDTLADLGPPPLRDGDHLDISDRGRPGPLAGEPAESGRLGGPANVARSRAAARPGAGSPVDSGGLGEPRGAAEVVQDRAFVRPTGPVEVRVMPGPHRDWIPVEALLSPEWTVTPRGDRVGLRLSGPRLPRRRGELPVAGMLPGAIQVPPDGQPILLLANCGPTGGYPVPATVITADLPRAGQARPGAHLRFIAVDRTTAVAALRERRAELEAATRQLGLHGSTPLRAHRGEM